MQTDSEVAASLNLGGTASVKSVSCSTASFCVAGGSFTNSSGGDQAFVSVYNGSSWTDSEIAASLNIDNHSQVNSVSCYSASFCVAGGSYTAVGEFGDRAFVSVYNGSSWTVSDIAALNTAYDSSGNVVSFNISSNVNSVSCYSASFCVAGGSYADSSHHNQAFVSVYNGGSWTDSEIAASLNIDNDAQVNSVSCYSASFCLSGGSFRNSSAVGYQAFVSVYNGTTWSDREVAASLNTGGSASVGSVSCSTASFCVAGGSYADSSYNLQAFVSVYNGTTWSDREVAKSFTSNSQASVNSVSCFAPKFCVAGGSYLGSTTGYQAFVSVYNGTTWSDREVAGSLNSGNAHVNSVSCYSASFCVAGGAGGGAGGFYSNSSGVSTAFVSVYNGTSWTDSEVARSLNLKTVSFASVNGVSCSTASFCVAGGSYADSSHHNQAFVSVYNGATIKIKATATSKKPVTTTINCYKGKLLKKVTAVKPVCPAGYVKK